MTSKNNWYAKLHRLDSSSEQSTIASNQQISVSSISNTHAKANGDKPSHLSNTVHRLNLSIFFRLWLALAVIVVVAGLIVFNQLFEYIEPTSKQAIEDTLVDTGKVLSVSLSKPLQSGQLLQPNFQAQLDKAFRPDIFLQESNVHNSRQYHDAATLNTLSTWFNQKTHSSFRIYVTDKQGTVIYDSLPINPNDSRHDRKATRLTKLNGKWNAEGEDYSQWNDVFLTLKGEYGARSSRREQMDATTAVMYVAQPIVNDNDQLIGVVSVGKPVATILPYVSAARQRMFTSSLVIMAIALALSGLVAWWLQQSIALVTRYTQNLADNRKKPSFYLGRELNELTDTIESMKHQLENKAYVTDYVHTLTHELKSPLTAIRASGELLADASLESDDRQLLSHTITEQSIKLQSLIDRLLLLAKIEQPNFRLNIEMINPISIINSLLLDNQARIQQKQLTIAFYYQHHPIDIEALLSKQLQIPADVFWLSQTLENLLSNAIHFAKHHIRIEISSNIEINDETNNLNLIRIDSNPDGSSSGSNSSNISDSRFDNSFDDSFDKSATDDIAQNRNHKSGYLQLNIYNDGDTIPTYALDKVFDRYFSLSHQTHKPQTQKTGEFGQSKDATEGASIDLTANSKPNKKGSGLGLTLAKQVIEHHGGRINITNVSHAYMQHMQKNIGEHDKTGIDSQSDLSGVMVSIYLPRFAS